MSDFDPYNVQRFDWNTGTRKVNGEFVLSADYQKLLGLYNELKPQMTLAERYGTITVK